MALITPWPEKEERLLLGRFYLIGGVSTFFYVIWPFQFAYLFMVMERPEWAVIPFLLETGIAIAADVPTGLFADRYGRKRAVIIGESTHALAFALVPLAVAFEGGAQLVFVSACLGLSGLGQAFVSGAGEAWVVDNLVTAARYDLVDSYFARKASFMALGSVGAGALALTALLALDVTRTLLDSLWIVAASGIFIGAAIAWTIPEQRPSTASINGATSAAMSYSALFVAGVRIIRRSRALLFFIIAVVVTAFPESAADDAFDMSLITKGMDARGLAPLGMIDNLIGVTAPLLGMMLLRRYGPTPILVLFLAIPALLVSMLFVAPTLWFVIALYVLLDAMDNVWDPVAEAHLQTLINSDSRATVVSIVNHLGGLVEMLGIGVFAVVLGEHSAELSAIVPDLVDAFAGRSNMAASAPTSALGLTAPDLAIVIFIAAGLLAIPFLVISARILRRAPVGLRDDGGTHR